MEGQYIYETEIYNTIAAKEVVPILLELLNPSSVIDIGCGLGTWLMVFHNAGVKDIAGVDGDYVNRSALHIEESQFITADLTKPFRHDRQFDLVVSLEVAEHIPEPSSDLFIETLVAHGNQILFSAAVPGQNGQNHVNEQWPSYWQEKFAKHGYFFHDIIRARIWLNSKVDVWYRQNMFLITKQLPHTNNEIMPVIHPDLYNHNMKHLQQMLNQCKQHVKNFEEGNMGVKLGSKILFKALCKKLRINGK